MYREQRFKINQEILEDIRQEIVNPIPSTEDGKRKRTELFYKIKYVHLKKAVMPPLNIPDVDLSLLFYHIRRSLEEKKEYVYANNIRIGHYYNSIRFNDDDNSIEKRYVQRNMENIRQKMKDEIPLSIRNQLIEYSKILKTKYVNLNANFYVFILALKKAYTVDLELIIVKVRDLIVRNQNQADQNIYLKHIRLRNVLTEYYETYVHNFKLEDFKHNYECLALYYPRILKNEKTLTNVFVGTSLFVPYEQFTENTYPDTELTNMVKYKEHVSKHTKELITCFKSRYIHGILKSICLIKHEQGSQLTMEDLYIEYGKVCDKLENSSFYEFYGNVGVIEDLIIDSISSWEFRKREIKLKQNGAVIKFIQVMLYTICILRDIIDQTLLLEIEQQNLQITFSVLISNIIRDKNIEEQYVEECMEDMRIILGLYNINMDTAMFNFENTAPLMLSIYHHVYFVSVYIFENFFNKDENLVNNFVNNMANMFDKNPLPYDAWLKIHEYLQPNITQFEKYITCKIQYYLRYLLKYETTVVSFVLSISRLHKLVLID